MKLKDHPIYIECHKEKNLEEFGEGWDEIRKSSNKKRWWRCPIKDCHVYLSYVCDKTRTDSRKVKCPICSGKKVCPCSCNSLRTLFPEIAEMWVKKLNEKDCSDYTKGSKTKAWWKCNKSKCGKHIWKVGINDMTRTDGKNSNCPYCSTGTKHKKVCPCGCNSLSYKFPELSKEYHEDNDLVPNEILPHSKKIVKWQCSKKDCHIWEAKLQYRTDKRTKGCPFCAKKKMCICGCDSLGEKYPELTKEFNKEKNIISPYKIFPNNRKKVWWKCKKCNHDWKMRPSNRVSGNQGCIKCTKAGYSKMSLEWLKTMKIVNNINIQHIFNGKEYKIGKYKMDGFCKETNTTFEFNGDFWHGNPKKYNQEDMNIVCKKSFEDLYKNTLKKKELVKTKGYNYIEIWEMDWLRYKKLLKSIRK